MLVATLLCPRVAHAQARFELGAYGGVTSSKPLTYTCIDLLRGDPCSPSTSEPHYRETGFAVGAYSRYQFHSVAHLETDLLYSQKGENGGPNGTHTTHHYLELPLLVQFDPLRAKSPARVFVVGGISPAVRIGCSVTGPIFDNDAHMAVNYSGSCADLPAPLNDREPKVFDLGVVVGAGIGWDFAFGTIELQARYTRGLLDTTAEESGKTVNRALSLIAGFGVAIGHSRHSTPLSH